MKKLSILFAALLTATVMNVQATNVYFKLTAATSWWANDGAKIGALFKVGTDPLDFGMYAQFFTLVPGTTDTYVGTVPVPEGEDPFVAVQFLRYNSAATNPDELNYWNATVLMTWDGINDMFTATAFGDTWDSTTGNWSKYSPAGPDMHDFLYFVGLNGNDTVRLNKFTLQAADQKNLTATFEYSKDRINWSAYSWADFVVFLNTSQGDPIALNQGDTVFFRAKGTNGKNATMSVNNSAYFQFAFGADDQIAAGGNTMSLYDATCEQDTMTDYGFSNLFEGANQLLNAPKVPAKTLKTSCYRCMFRNCSSLVDAPALPATTLQEQCYYQMFKSCTSLTQAPELKATTLADGCYNAMFSNCTSLTQAPELPATTLPQSCYNAMFQGCTSLTQAPELKATTLGDKCYMNMFNGCTSLEVNSFSVSCDGEELEVPTVSGTVPANWNRRMFTGCKGDTALTAETGIQLGGHYCIREYGKPLPPDMHDFLYFVGLNGNDTVKLNKIGSNYANLTATFEYSTDRTTWNNYTWPDDNGKGGYAIALENAGDTVFFRAKGTNGKNATVGLNASTNFTFAFGADDQIAAGGNVMSLYDATCEQDTTTAHGFYKLFNGAKQLVSASELKLTATQLAAASYGYMFNGCTSLTQAPELKATTLANTCYRSMFQNCTTLQVDTCADDAQCTGALLVVPATGATNWNHKMFDGCKGTVTTPQLNGHYCIKEYVEPDTVVVNCIPSYGARQFYPQDNDFFMGLGNNDYSARFDILLPKGTTEMVYGKEYTLSDMDLNFSFFTIVQPFSQPAYQSCSVVRIGLNYYATAIVVGDPNTIYLINYIADTYTRPVTKGNFGTICLDKKFTAMKGVEALYVPYEKNDTVLYCEEVSLSDVVAGGAYIFKADSDAVVFSIEGDAATAVNNDHMIGWLAGDSVLAQAPAYYMLYNNQLVAPQAGSTIKENRAFINLADVPGQAAAPARGRLIKFGIDGTNTTTGMVDVNANVNANRKMMKDGQLVIIRDGVKFNAMGVKL